MLWDPNSRWRTLITRRYILILVVLLFSKLSPSQLQTWPSSLRTSEYEMALDWAAPVPRIVYFAPSHSSSGGEASEFQSNSPRQWAPAVQSIVSAYAEYCKLTDSVRRDERRERFQKYQPAYSIAIYGSKKQHCGLQSQCLAERTEQRRNLLS